MKTSCTKIQRLESLLWEISQSKNAIIYGEYYKLKEAVSEITKVKREVDEIVYLALFPANVYKT